MTEGPKYNVLPIDDAARVQWYEAMNGQQAGDPAKLARTLVTIVGQEPPPRRIIAGFPQVEGGRIAAAELLAVASDPRAILA